LSGCVCEHVWACIGRMVFISVLLLWWCISGFVRTNLQSWFGSILYHLGNISHLTRCTTLYM